MLRSLCSRLTLIAGLTAVLVAAIFGQERTSISDRARKLHFDSIVLDTHIDVTPNLQQKNWSFFEQHATGDVDYPRMLYRQVPLMDRREFELLIEHSQIRSIG